VETKQVIVLRKDLNMRKGKMVAQGAHASMKVFFDRMVHLGLGVHQMEASTEMHHWMTNAFTKICVSVNSEQELLDIYNSAKNEGIPCSLIQDAGRTEFGGVPTYTAVAVGPDRSEVLDKITSKLPLL
jgi:peptidyl-tRNA hydrolase, PTH2 family